MAAAKGVQCLELPLIKHAEGPDLQRLGETLRDVEFEWIVLTSPEAASDFLNGWREGGSPSVRLAVVESGTGEVICNAGAESEANSQSVNVFFTPTKAIGKALVVELPKAPEGSGRVLYPASVKASNDIEEGLTARGFDVTRLNTYSTSNNDQIDRDALRLAASAKVAAFASPTAVKAWVELVMKESEWDGAAACIGSTSAEAARKYGFKRIFYPDKPGIDGWVDSILEALEAPQASQVVTM
eukprot:SM000017S02892  [mRNA]  locus=s17:884584:887160:- [translate_table: standard]